MTARIFSLDGDERFVRASSSDDGDELPVVVPSTAGFSGAISLPLLPDLIQIYTVSMANGALTIRRGAQTGTIWFEQGAMVHAVCGEETGEEAVYELLRWDDGRFSLDQTGHAPFHSITASWQKVLMEGCRRLDEASLTNGSAPVPAPVPPPAGLFAEAFAEIEQSLGGFLAAAVLESADGSVLAQRSQGGLDLAAAGPLIAEWLRQQSTVMQSLHNPSPLHDSLSILGDQVHLLAALPEGRLLYLVATRDANLAVLRRVVDQVLGKRS